MAHEHSIKVAKNGRMVLPVQLRRHIGLEGEGLVVASLEGTTVKLRPMTDKISEVQKLVRQWSKTSYSTNDLLKDRKAETLRDKKR